MQHQPPQTQPAWHARAAVVLAALLWATAGFASRLAPAGVTAPAFGAVRLLLGGSLLWCVTSRAQRRAALHVCKPWPLLGAVLGLAAFQWSLFAAVATAGSGSAALISAGVAPFASEGWRNARSGRPPSARLGLGLLVLAVALIAAVRTGGGRASGWAAALASGCAYALYSEAMARLDDGVRSLGRSLALSGLVLFGSALLLAPGACAGMARLASPRGVLVALYLGVFATGVAYAGFAFGLARLGPVSALGLLTVQPAVAVALGWACLQEPLDAPLLLASAAIAATRLLPGEVEGGAHDP